MTLTAPGLEGLRAPGGPLSEDLFAGSDNPATSNGRACPFLHIPLLLPVLLQAPQVTVASLPQAWVCGKEK